MQWLCLDVVSQLTVVVAASRSPRHGPTTHRRRQNVCADRNCCNLSSLLFPAKRWLLPVAKKCSHTFFAPCLLVRSCFGGPRTHFLSGLALGSPVPVAARVS